jgi:hypothetical protein
MICRIVPTKSQRILLAVAPLIAATLLIAGCASKSDKWKFAQWDVRRAIGMKPKKSEPEVPTRLVATWSDATLNKVGEPAKRGFGGRLVFFKDEIQDPVRVEGQLVVYAYDESAMATPGAAPTRRYIVTQDQFAKQEGSSSLGTYYSVWLPWDEVGGPPKKISLITRFEPKEGPIVLGEQTNHYLPGIEAPTEKSIAVAPSPSTQAAAATASTNPANGQAGVQLAAFNGEKAPVKENREKPSLSTATIDLPLRVGQALQSLPSEPTPAIRNTTVRKSSVAVQVQGAGAPTPQLAPGANAAATAPQAAPPSTGSGPAISPAPAGQAAPPTLPHGDYLRSLEVSPFGRKSESGRRP